MLLRTIPQRDAATAWMRTLTFGTALFLPAMSCFGLGGSVVRHVIPPNPVAESEKLVMQGRADDAIAKLRGLESANTDDGRIHLLLCRAFYSEDLADAAIGECEAALTTMSDSSEAQDWMGRAYGIKADRSGPITGYKLAGRVKAAFEKAVELDPHNADAVNDAAEYYVGAPSMVGGGIDKALALANRSQAALPQVAHRIRALVAEKEHDYGTAEREFKAAVDVAGRPDAWVDLGHFYARRGQTSQALDALQHAVTADRNHGPELVDVATILLKMNVSLDLAQRVLDEYLASNAKSDAAPAFKAYFELGEVVAAIGDPQRARMQYQAALQLARDYAPAKKALQHS